MSAVAMNPAQFTFGALASPEAVYGKQCYISPDGRQGYVVLPAKEYARLEELEDKILAITADLLLRDAKASDFEDWSSVQSRLGL